MPGAVLVQFQHPDVQDRALLQGRPQGAVQAVFEVQLAVPADDVREQVAIERRIGGQDRVQVQHVLRGDKLIEPDWPRRNLGPFPARLGMVRVGPPVPNPLENHVASLDEVTAPLRVTGIVLGGERAALGPVSLVESCRARIRLELLPSPDKLTGGGFA